MDLLVTKMERATSPECPNCREILDQSERGKLSTVGGNNRVVSVCVKCSAILIFDETVVRTWEIRVIVCNMSRNTG